MNDEYTPTTEEMREDWGALVVPIIAPPPSAQSERKAEFDRWLHEHDQAIRAEVIEAVERDTRAPNSVALGRRLREHFALSSGGPQTKPDNPNTTKEQG